jgi:hypothetical protein
MDYTTINLDAAEAALRVIGGDALVAAPAWGGAQPPGPRQAEMGPDSTPLALWGATVDEDGQYSFAVAL